jgi:tryptophan synthase alpha chain
MSRIATVFSQSGHKALIAYVTTGYPSIEATLQLVPFLVENGCDIIELGIPFSDPLADGATIQKASFHALKNGVTPGICLEVARKLSGHVSAPLIFMTYFNPILSYGLEKFCHDCGDSGIDGLIVPDLPPEEGTLLEGFSRDCLLDVIYLLPPSATPERIKLVAARSRGFIYLVTVTGVTGAREQLSRDLSAFVAGVRKETGQPLCLGFGISSPEQAAEAARIADGVIIGSHLIQLAERDTSLATLASFIRGVRAAIDKSS